MNSVIVGFREKRRKAFSENEYLRDAICVIEASAQNGEGMKELKEVIEKAASDELFPEEAAEEIPEAPPVPVTVKAVRRKV